MGLFQSKPAPQPFAVGMPIQVGPAPVQRTNWVRILVFVAGGALLLYLGFAFYNYIRKRRGQEPIDLFKQASSGDKTPTPVDGKTKTVIPASEVPVGPGADYGVQFWMYIADWDYRFGQEKKILSRLSSNNAAIRSPEVSLAATENTLNVKVSLFATDNRAGASAPAMNSTGDVFTCSVENVPLQRWFSVSVTVFQRNMDIYIDGRLVKSCVLPGVPKPAFGDIVLNDEGGFSGSVCNVHSYTTMLTPKAAKDFYAAGTNCAAPKPSEESQTVDPDSWTMKLFGYNFRFTRLDKLGKEISSYTF